MTNILAYPLQVLPDPPPSIFTPPFHFQCQQLSPGPGSGYPAFIHSLTGSGTVTHVTRERVCRLVLNSTQYSALLLSTITQCAVQKDQNRKWITDWKLLTGVGRK